MGAQGLAGAFAHFAAALGMIRQRQDGLRQALDVAVRDGRIQSGQNVLIEGFGGGFTWGSALIKM